MAQVAQSSRRGAAAWGAPVVALLVAAGCVPAPRSDTRTTLQLPTDATVSPSTDAGEVTPDGGVEADAAIARDTGVEPAPDGGGAQDGGVVLPPDSGVEPPPQPVGCAPPIPDDAPDTLFFCACDEGAATGCEAGDDANDGRHPSRAKRSLQDAAAAFTAGGPGSQVALCRGGAWRTEGARLFPTACEANRRCVFGDYGDPAKPRPTLIGIGTNVGTLGLDPSEATPRASFDVRNLIITRVPGTAGSSVGVFIFADVRDVNLSCLAIDNHALGVQLNPNDTPASGIRLLDSDVSNNTVIGFLGAGDDLVIARSRFDNNGFGEGTPFNHNIYISGPGSSLRNVHIADNHLSRSAVDDTGRCVGVSLVVHGGQIEDLVIEHNVVEEPPGGAGLGCWGIVVDAASSSADANLRTIIRGNLVRDVGNVGIGVASCVDCTIENNVIVQRETGGHIGIRVPVAATQAPDADLSSATIRNNTIWFGPNAVGGLGIEVGERGTGHVVTSNIVAMDPASDPAGWCFAFDLGPEAYSLVEGNLGFGCGTYELGTQGMDPLRLEQDPGFVNAPDDLSLRADSPARNSGSPSASASVDIEGRPRDGTPDRGAYEAP